MGRTGQVVVAVAVAVCLLATFISPLVPSPLTTLRNHTSPAAPHAAAVAGALLQPLAAVSFSPPEYRLPWRPAGAALIDLTCVRLC